MPDTTYTVTLADGRKVPLQFDHVPTMAEVQAKLGTAGTPSTPKPTEASQNPILTALGAWKGLFSKEAWKSLTTAPNENDLMRDAKQYSDYLKQYGKGAAEGFIGALPPVALFNLAKAAYQGKLGDIPEGLEQSLANAINLNAETVGSAMGTVGGLKATNVFGTALVNNPKVQEAVNTVGGTAAGAVGAKAAGISPYIGGFAGRNILKGSKLPVYLGRGLQMMSGGAPAQTAEEAAAAAARTEVSTAAEVMKKAAETKFADRIKQVGGDHPSWTPDKVVTEVKRQLAAETEQDANIDALVARQQTSAAPAAPAPSATAPPQVAPGSPPGPTAGAPAPVPTPAPVVRPAVAGAPEPAVPASAAPPATPAAGGLRLSSKALTLQDQVQASTYRKFLKQAIDAEPDLNKDPEAWHAAALKLMQADEEATAKATASGVGIPRQVPKLVLTPEEAAAEAQLKKAYSPSAALQGMKAAARVPVPTEDVPYDPSTP